MEQNLTFSDNWDFYPAQMGGYSLSIRFDTSVDQLPEETKAQYPHILVLQIPFLEAREDGFPTTSELQRVNQIEDSFNLDTLDVRLIGVLTGGSCSRFVFCCAAASISFEKIAQQLMSKVPNCKYGYQLFEADHFGYYTNVLSPDPLQQNWIANRNVCYSLEQQGEQFSAPRPIDFFFYFETEQALVSVLPTLIAKKFREAGHEQKEDASWQLHMTLEDIPSLARMTEITEYLMFLANDNGGYFDGWGCTAITTESP